MSATHATLTAYSHLDDATLASLSWDTARLIVDDREEFDAIRAVPGRHAMARRMRLRMRMLSASATLRDVHAEQDARD